MIIMYSQNHAADALVTQGATTLAIMVLTLLSQNKTCKTQTLVYGTCEPLFLIILTLRKNGHGSDWRGAGGGGQKIWIVGGGTRKKKDKRGRGLEGKEWVGAGGWIPGVGGPDPLSSPTILLKENQEFLQWITITANPLSSRDSWVVNRIVTEVNHCSAEYSIALYQYICHMYIGPLSFESYHSSNEKLINLSPPLVIAYH